MPDEKNRLGEKLERKGEGEEDRYFAEQDRQRLEKLRQARQDTEHAARRAEVGSHCPRCSEPLAPVQVEGVGTDQCPAGCGMWLDRGELEQIAARMKDSWLARLFRLKPARTG